MSCNSLISTTEIEPPNSFNGIAFEFHYMLYNVHIIHNKMLLGAEDLMWFHVVETRDTI